MAANSSGTAERDYRSLIRTLSDRLVAAQAPIRILDSVKWEDEVRQAFFASQCRRPPPVDRAYYLARPLPEGLEPARRELEALIAKLETELGEEDPAGRMMLRMCEEYDAVICMLEARGTPDFNARSAALYGRSTDPFHQGGPSLVELAQLLDESLRNLGDEAFVESEAADLSAEQAVLVLQERMDAYFRGADVRVRVRISDGIVADAAAGSDYIKLRAGARFGTRDLRVLEVHEGWVHVGTTLAGRAQPVCSFLSKGTPSTTVT